MSDNRSDLRSVLADFGAKFSGDVVSDFGSPEEEYRSLVERSVPLLVPLLATTSLKLTGEDRVPFLHGQVSNDVVGPPGRGGKPRPSAHSSGPCCG